jgi:hypothetical protein
MISSWFHILWFAPLLRFLWYHVLLLSNSNHTFHSTLHSRLYNLCFYSYCTSSTLLIIGCILECMSCLLRSIQLSLHVSYYLLYLPLTTLYPPRVVLHWINPTVICYNSMMAHWMTFCLFYDHDVHSKTYLRIIDTFG